MADCQRKTCKILNLDDVEDGDLINTSDEENFRNRSRSKFDCCNLELSKAKLLFETG